jgi:ribosomal protein L16 Arg81 hydroxylase
MFAALFLKYKVGFFAGIAIMAVVGSMWLRIAYLKADRATLTAEVAVLESNMLVARQTNSINVVAIGDLIAKLEDCVGTNRLLEESSRQALENYKRQVEIIREGVRKDLDEVRVALQNETCAMVAIPSDVERVLRNGAARANGDS